MHLRDTFFDISESKGSHMKDKNLRVVLSFLGILTFFRPLKTSTGVMELWNTFYSIWKNSGWEFSYILLMMLGQEKENQSFFRT